jgi:hypothetical protein
VNRPALEDLATAAEWLRFNEGDDGEREACSRVATWLDTYARESAERQAARKVGCSVKYFRKFMADHLGPITNTGEPQPMVGEGRGKESSC